MNQTNTNMNQANIAGSWPTNIHMNQTNTIWIKLIQIWNGKIYCRELASKPWRRVVPRLSALLSPWNCGHKSASFSSFHIEHRSGYRKKIIGWPLESLPHIYHIFRKNHTMCIEITHSALGNIHFVKLPGVCDLTQCLIFWIFYCQTRGKFYTAKLKVNFTHSVL